MCMKTDEEEGSVCKVVFSKDTTFRVSGISNRLKCRIWGYSPPKEYLKHEGDIPKANVLGAFTREIYNKF